MPINALGKAWVLLVLSLVLGGSALAQNWPSKPVRFLVAQGPGLAPDICARWVANRLTQNLGKPFVVENVQGGGGIVAAQAALRAGPDGYTYFLGGAGMIATDRHMYKSIPFDAERDFTPVAMLFDNGAFMVAVHPDVPAKTLPELIALAKSRPGKLNYGSDSVGVTLITGQWFNKIAGTDIVGIAYKNPGQLVQDFISGRTQVIFVALSNLDAHIKAGKARALAVTSDSRFPTYPNIPTVSETLPGFKVFGIGLLVAPAGTPTEIVQRLNREIDQVVKAPEYIDLLLTFGWTNNGGARTTPALVDFMRSERERWNDVFKIVKFEPE